MRNSRLAIPRFLRVRELEINEDESGRVFVKCTCCERTKVGVPCPCFFRIARDKNIPFEEIMDIGMFDVRYLKLFDAKYGSDDQAISDMLFDAQEVCCNIHIPAPLKL